MQLWSHSRGWTPSSSRSLQHLDAFHSCCKTRSHLLRITQARLTGTPPQPRSANKNMDHESKKDRGCVNYKNLYLYIYIFIFMSRVEKQHMQTNSVAKARNRRGLRKGILFSRPALKWTLLIDNVEGHLQSVARPGMHIQKHKYIGLNLQKNMQRIYGRFALI